MVRCGLCNLFLQLYRSKCVGRVGISALVAVAVLNIVRHLLVL